MYPACTASAFSYMFTSTSWQITFSDKETYRYAKQGRWGKNYVASDLFSLVGQTAFNKELQQFVYCTLTPSCVNMNFWTISDSLASFSGLFGVGTRLLTHWKLNQVTGSECIDILPELWRRVMWSKGRQKTALA